MSRKYKFHNPEGLYVIKDNAEESRKEWLIRGFRKAGSANPSIVFRAEDYLYSSAADYAGERGLLKIDMLW